jgi:hypothetical protein
LSYLITAKTKGGAGLDETRTSFPAPKPDIALRRPMRGTLKPWPF